MLLAMPSKIMRPFIFAVLGLELRVFKMIHLNFHERVS
jgi:hypothetical protein